LPLSDPQALAEFIGQLVRDSAGLPTDPRASLIDSLQPIRVAGQANALIGSASVRQGDRFWITPNNALRGALGSDAIGSNALEPEDLIACALDAPAPLDAALDASIHCEVYRQQPNIGALFQTKGPYSMALGLIGRQVEPLDDDGARLLGRVSVIAVEPIEHPAEASARVAETLAASAACIVARHGAYLAGATVREVHRRALALEHSAQIILLARAANAG
jgi:L-fuculose-phosphate aldolase